MEDKVLEPTSFLGEHSEVLLDQHRGDEAAREVQGLSGEQIWEEREGRNKLRHVTGLGELEDILRLNIVRFAWNVLCSWECGRTEKLPWHKLRNHYASWLL